MVSDMVGNRDTFTSLAMSGSPCDHSLSRGPWLRQITVL